MAFKGKDGSGWKEASAIYGKDATGWLYAKEVWAKDATGWKRAWTDCRKHDEGGRGWTPAPGVTEYQGTCGNRQSRVRTDYSKTGCDSYSRYTSWVSSPDCNSTCFDASTSTVYRYSCASRESTTRTTYTAKSGSGCTTYYVDGTWVSSPTCEGACTTAKTTSYFESGGIGYYYSGTPGYYDAFPNPNCSPGCDFSTPQYYITTCNGVDTFTLIYNPGCLNAFGDPC